MIIKNEEKLLDKFLSKIKKYVDEIIVVDTGSTDNSFEIAKKYGKVYSFEWKDDFSSARNFSISKASSDWILVLDPDEIVDKENLIKIKKIIKENKYLGYRLIQETYFNCKKIGVRGICRLFKNDKRIKFEYNIHETVMNSIKKIGKIGKTGIVIKHYPDLDKDKKDYYLKLLEKKKKLFTNSKVDKEIENEERERTSLC